MNDDDDHVVEQLVAVFEQARDLVRTRGLTPHNPVLEMPAMDLLMDYALGLGSAGLVDVMTALVVEPDRPINRTEMQAAINRHFAAKTGWQ